MLWSLVMALSLSDSTIQLLAADKQRVWPLSTISSSSFLLSSFTVCRYIYIYTFLSQRLGRWAMCLVLYIYNRPLHHHHHHQPSLNSNIDLPSRRRGPETPCVHPSLQRGKMRSTYTQREKSGRFETSKVCAASTFFLFCFVDDEKTRS